MKQKQYITTHTTQEDKVFKEINRFFDDTDFVLKQMCWGVYNVTVMLRWYVFIFWCGAVLWLLALWNNDLFLVYFFEACGWGIGLIAVFHFLLASVDKMFTAKKVVRLIHAHLTGTDLLKYDNAKKLRDLYRRRTQLNEQITPLEKAIRNIGN